MFRISAHLSAIAIVFLVSPAPAADPPGVRLPEVRALPAPGSTIRLSTTELYVFDSDVVCLVTTSPPGVLAVTKEDGPVKVKGVFAGGPGKVETRTFKGKFVYTVDVAATGRAELLVIPAGMTDEAGILRRMIDANAGPRPPPDVPPDVPIDPVLTPFQLKLQAAYRSDGAALESKAKYAAFFRQAAKTAQDGSLTTCGQLSDDMKAAVKLIGIPAGTLDRTAKAIQDEVIPLLPKSPTALLDGPTRNLYTATYNRIAQDLEVIK